MKTHDSVGRGLFAPYTQKPLVNFVPNPRQVRWLQWLNLHGLASTKYLHECTSGTHRCVQTTSRMLRQLYDGQLIMKPRQQRATTSADSNFTIYALSERGAVYLKDAGLWVDAIQPTGHWVHQYMVACIAASLHLTCQRAGLQFIPGHKITQQLAVKIPYDWNGRRYENTLIPDSLFAIRYPTGFIAYALEADRSTETIDPTSPYRKSVRRNVRQYENLVGTGRYKEVFNLNCPLMVLNVTVSDTRARRCLEILCEETGACRYHLFAVVPEFRTPFRPPKYLLNHLFDQPLTRAGMAPFSILSGGNNNK